VKTDGVSQEYNRGMNRMTTATTTTTTNTPTTASSTKHLFLTKECELIG
jgi:hypothetical protein